MCESNSLCLFHMMVFNLVIQLWQPRMNYTAPEDLHKFMGRHIRFLETALDHHGCPTPNQLSKSGTNITIWESFPDIHTLSKV